MISFSGEKLFASSSLQMLLPDAKSRVIATKQD
jgi:hypothetical protein